MHVLLSLVLAQDTAHTAEAPDGSTSVWLILAAVAVVLLICAAITLAFRKSRALNRAPGRTTPD